MLAKVGGDIPKILRDQRLPTSLSVIEEGAARQKIYTTATRPLTDTLPFMIYNPFPSDIEVPYDKLRQGLSGKLTPQTLPEFVLIRIGRVLRGSMYIMEPSRPCFRFYVEPNAKDGGPDPVGDKDRSTIIVRVRDIGEPPVLTNREERSPPPSGLLEKTNIILSSFKPLCNEVDESRTLKGLDIPRPDPKTRLSARYRTPQEEKLEQEEGA